MSVSNTVHLVPLKCQLSAIHFPVKGVILLMHLTSKFTIHDSHKEEKKLICDSVLHFSFPAVLVLDISITVLHQSDEENKIL